MLTCLSHLITNDIIICAYIYFWWGWKCYWLLRNCFVVFFSVLSFVWKLHNKLALYNIILSYCFVFFSFKGLLNRRFEPNHFAEEIYKNMYFLRTILDMHQFWRSSRLRECNFFKDLGMPLFSQFSTLVTLQKLRN